jgi:hypothetical protein
VWCNYCLCIVKHLSVFSHVTIGQKNSNAVLRENLSQSHKQLLMLRKHASSRPFHHYDFKCRGWRRQGCNQLAMRLYHDFGGKERGNTHAVGGGIVQKWLFHIVYHCARVVQARPITIFPAQPIKNCLKRKAQN